MKFAADLLDLDPAVLDGLGPTTAAERRHPHVGRDCNAPGPRAWSAQASAGGAEEGGQEIQNQQLKEGRMKVDLWESRNI
jgi:hypothetical protein